MRIRILTATFLAITLALGTGCAATADSRSTGQVVDDSSIATRVKAALASDKTTDAVDIEVEVERGVVQLIGFVGSQAELDQATTVARGVTGVASVENGLQITDGSGSRRVGQYIDDKVLLARVNAALTKAADVSVMAIEVEVNRSTVVLGGFVDSAQESESAYAAAMRVEGVQKVVNNLRVRTPG